MVGCSYHFPSKQSLLLRELFGYQKWLFQGQAIFTFSIDKNHENTDIDWDFNLIFRNKQIRRASLCWAELQLA